jgi:hypothetical protein
MAGRGVVRFGAAGLGKVRAPVANVAAGHFQNSAISKNEKPTNKGCMNVRCVR